MDIYAPGNDNTIYIYVSNYAWSVSMPTHSLVGYDIGLRQSGNQDAFWPLHDLHTHNRTLPDNHIINSLDRLFDTLSQGVRKDGDKEKAYIVEDYYTSDNIAEAVVTAGNYGYEAALRNVASGNETYQKSEDEAEFMRYYLLFWIPQTIRGVPYNDGEKGIMMFQNVSGGGVKTLFESEFNEQVLSSAEQAVFDMDPITSQDLLQKIIDSKGAKRVVFDLKESAQNTDHRMQLANGVESQDVEQQQIVWKAKRGGYIGAIKETAKELQRSGSNFASIAGDDTDDMTVKIKRDDDRTESFSVIKNEPKMRVHLSPTGSAIDRGLPTTQYLCKEACYTINEQYDSNVVESLDHDTAL